MDPQHLNPSTGVVAPCVLGALCPLPSELHGERERLQVLQQKALDLQAPEPPSPEEAVLLRALADAAAGGFAKASEVYDKYLDAQVDLLLNPLARKALALRLVLCNGERRKRIYAEALAWSARRLADAQRESPQRWFHRELEALLITNEARARVQAALQGPDPSTGDLLKAAGDLWIARDAPLHHQAKRALFGEVPRLRGYKPQELRTCTVHDNRAVAKALQISWDRLPEGALAFDIETDTSEGYGLRPTHSQITEVVISSREKSWVLAGDERFILESFADLLNAQETPVVLVGWNNYSFDGLALQTRAELHGIPEWRGYLTPAESHTPFEPCGPTGDHYSFTWVTPEGLVIRDRDLYQEKSYLDRRAGLSFTLGLKPFLESLGCTPVKVDRSRLHTLSEERRMEYVLSDGLCTLRALDAVDALERSSVR